MTQVAAATTASITVPVNQTIDLLGYGTVTAALASGQPNTYNLNGKLTLIATGALTLTLTTVSVVNYYIYNPLLNPNDPSIIATSVEAASRTLLASDNGKTLECSATITLTIPVGLPRGFSVWIMANGTTSIASDGTAVLNGATTTLTRVAATAANVLFRMAARESAIDSYAVGGV